ncbi:MAG: PAC2 family protein [Acidimicrobiales bacterium]|jgi:proteasome assembly chaperone (PAC2) family protein|nr:PAC2 family protein [Acidimicrobiales bacterium]
MASTDDSPTPQLAHVRWTTRPELEAPVLLMAFEGWNDAGSSATGALGFFERSWGTEPFADIDAEDFFDFTETRPLVRFDDDGDRVIDWPDARFAAAEVRDGLHVVTLHGTEPQLRWRTFCEQVVGVARALDVELVVSMGSLLADVPHSRPAPVYGATNDTDLMERLDLSPSHYEGPTGIVGVLHTALRAAGIASASLWATVPTYVASAPSPKATLALVDRVCTLLDVQVEATDLAEEAAVYEARIDELVADDDETAAYVSQLERDFDDRQDELTTGRGSQQLIDEVERYLRNQP